MQDLKPCTQGFLVLSSALILATLPQLHKEEEHSYQLHLTQCVNFSFCQCSTATDSKVTASAAVSRLWPTARTVEASGARQAHHSQSLDEAWTSVMTRVISW